MNSIIMIREAEEKDLPQLRKILDYYIRETAVNFDFETPSEEAFAALWRSHRARYPFLVVQEGDTDHLLGYAYAGPFVGKSAYQWSAELTIYLDPARLHEGLGTFLYKVLERRLEEMGVHNLYACIAVPSEETDPYVSHVSESFHKSRGFQTVGRFSHCANKFGRWYDMIWMEKTILAPCEAPMPVMFRDDTTDGEFVDLCTEEGQPTGRCAERSFAHREGLLHRTAHVWIARQREGRTQVLLQKRSLTKDSFPGCYDTSSAGHIPAGREPVESALRELAEELGVYAIPPQLVPLGHLRVSSEREFHGAPFKNNEYVYLFLCEKSVDETTLHLQKEEIDEVRWFDLEELTAAVAAKDSRFCVPAESLQLLTEYLNRRKQG